MDYKNILVNSKNETKKILISYIAEDREEELEISPSKTVKYLKNEIARIFNLGGEKLFHLKLRLLKKRERRGKILDDDNKILFVYHISNGDRIIFTTLNCEGGGGFPMKFSDLKEPEFRTFSKSAPDWRYVYKGLNFYGICVCKFCDAGKDKNEVICPVNLKKNEEFNLIENRNKIVCPICSSYIEAKTIGIYGCKITVRGKQVEGNRIVPFLETFSSLNPEGVTKFKYGENNEVTWTELIIRIDQIYG